MRWIRGILEYEVRCSWCKYDKLTHLPARDAFRCDYCAREYDTAMLLNNATAIDLLTGEEL